MDRKCACHCSKTMILLMSHVKLYHRGFRKLLVFWHCHHHHHHHGSRKVSITPTPTQDTHHRPCVQRQGTLASPPAHPKTPVIAVASTMCATSRNVSITPTPIETPVIAVASTMSATSRNVTITPTPTQDTHHCRSIDHVCNVKER